MNAMKKILDYDFNRDDEVYLEATTSVGKNFLQKLHILAATTSGSKDGVNKKPNEDAFSVYKYDNKLFILVLDGNSSLKPIKFLGILSGARYASHFLAKEFPKVIRVDDDPQDVLIDLNKRLLATVLKFEGTNIHDTHTLPGAMGTLVIVDPDNNKVTIGHVGDTFCVYFYKNGSSKVITNDLNEKFDTEMLTRMFQIAKETDISPREARHSPEIEKALITMFNERNNRQDGKGVGLINGNPNMEEYIQIVETPLNKLHAILIGTDGLPPVSLSLTKESDRRVLQNQITVGGFQKLIKLKVEDENGDPDFWKYVRYKHSDDGTGVYIRVEK